MNTKFGYKSGDCTTFERIKCDWVNDLAQSTAPLSGRSYTCAKKIVKYIVCCGDHLADLLWHQYHASADHEQTAWKVASEKLR